MVEFRYGLRLFYKCRKEDDVRVWASVEEGMSHTSKSDLKDVALQEVSCPSGETETGVTVGIV